MSHLKYIRKCSKFVFLSASIYLIERTISENPSLPFLTLHCATHDVEITTRCPCTGSLSSAGSRKDNWNSGKCLDSGPKRRHCRLCGSLCPHCERRALHQILFKVLPGSKILWSMVNLKNKLANQKSKLNYTSCGQILRSPEFSLLNSGKS